MQHFLEDAEDAYLKNEEETLGAKATPSESEDDSDAEMLPGDENVQKAGNEIKFDDLYPSEPPAKRKKPMSRLQKEQEGIKDSIRVLEDEAVEDKEWPFRGEIAASDRPLNSALEVDLDFDTTLRPPPKPTQEHLDAIEALIKRRIGELNFDDVQRKIPPPITETHSVPKLDDAKAEKGLGDIYAEAYVQRQGGTLEEKEEKLRSEARKRFREACASIDALTHFHFAPKPIVEETSVRRTMPSISMEATPALETLGEATRAPQEIYPPPAKAKMSNEKEKTKTERKQLRAKKKRVFKAKQKTESFKSSTALLGRKSRIQEALQKTNKQRSEHPHKGKIGSSVFQQILSLETAKTKTSNVSQRQNSSQVKL